MYQTSLERWAAARFGNESPIRPTLRSVPVAIEILDIKDIGDAYSLEVDRKYKMTKVSNQFDVETFEKYVRTLLVLRVDHVMKKREFRDYDLRLYAVPSFVAALLINIGEADDMDYGVRLYPVIDYSKEDLLSKEQMRTQSSLIRALRDAFKPVDFPLHRDGNLDFMSKFVIDTAIKSYRPRDHVVYAFMTAVLQKTISDSLFLEMSTVTYGDRDIFRRELPIGEILDERPQLEEREPKE